MPVIRHTPNYLKRCERRRIELLTRAERVCAYLLELGATRVYLFGSILTDRFREHSDVDIAVEGLAPDLPYSVEAHVEDLLDGAPFDLVYLEQAKPYLKTKILATGRRYERHLSGHQG